MNARFIAATVAAVACCLPVAKSHARTPAEALERAVKLEFIDTPLQDVIDFLIDAANVRIVADAGIDRQQPVTIKVEGSTLRSALKLITAPRGLTFDAQADRIFISRSDGSDTSPEFGYKLKPQDALEGWIALFDGSTTFGWSGAKVGGGQLEGGQTSSHFGDYLLRAVLPHGGQITLGGKTIDVKPGVLYREVLGQGPIVLHPNTSVTLLEIQPLGLKRLFNGHDLGKWKRLDRDKTPVDKRPRWLVEDGVLRAIGGPGCIEYPTRYGDFVMQVDVRTRAKYVNGGVFFRSIPGDVMNGYEAQVYSRMVDSDPAKPFKWSTGSIDDRQLARRVVSRDYVKFRMTVVAKGSHISTWVNGYQLVDWTDTRAADENPRNGLRLSPGTIQLQAHDGETDAEFHAVNIAPLEQFR